MGWPRLPIYLANLKLSLLPLSAAQQKAYEATGFVKEIAFKCAPSVNKIEIRQFLQGVYGLRVEHVETVNYEGRKKRRQAAFFRRPDYKKAYVTLKEPPQQPKEA